jgi:LmbE family N-acetylglucosaminyl deacetylase
VALRADPSGPPPWAARSDRLDATQSDADAAAKRFWQRASWYRRASIRSEPIAGQPLIDDVPTQGAVLTEEVVATATAGDVMSIRRLEDERFAYFAEASVVFLDLPDAVFRGYEGDDQLLGELRADDLDIADILRREIARLEPQQVYVPLAIGNHVDHQLCREAGLSLLADGRRWIMPGPDYAGQLNFYEDFPYAWWNGFSAIEDLPSGALADLPADLALEPEYADITDQVERKITGISLYESQLPRLFGGDRPMGDAVRAFGRKVAALGGVDGLAERYWASRRT